MTGYPNLNEKAFSKAAKSLRKAGHQAVSPPEEDKKMLGGIPQGTTAGDGTWATCLRRDLRDLLQCSAIHLLDGWERSKGATLEVMIAKELRMKFVDKRGVELEAPRASHESILVEAERITNGPRRSTYGHPLDNFGRTAKIWSAVLDKEVTPEQVGLCMIGVKLAREVHSHTRDNLVDLAGYANANDMIHRKRVELAELDGLHDRISG